MTGDWSRKPNCCWKSTGLKLIIIFPLTGWILTGDSKMKMVYIFFNLCHSTWQPLTRAKTTGISCYPQVCNKYKKLSHTHSHILEFSHTHYKFTLTLFSQLNCCLNAMAGRLDINKNHFMTPLGIRS